MRYERPDMVVDAGDRIVLTFTVDVNDVLTDPTAVLLRVTRPDGTVTTYTREGTDVSSQAPDSASITRLAAGVYEGAFSTDVSLPGRWRAKMWGTGAATAAGNELVIQVQP